MSRERGSIALMAAGVCTALGFLALGGAFIGRVVNARNEAQRVADAAALSGGNIVRALGLPFDDAKRARAEEIARRNTRLPVAFSWGVAESADHDKLSLEVVATLGMEAPRFLYPGGTKTVTARAASGLGQQRLTEANRKFPRFVLVLDYSGSMIADLNGGNGHPSSIEVLKSSINALLDLHLPIKWGVVIFSSQVMKTVPLDAGTEPTRGYDEQIRQVVNATQLGNMTNTSAALDRARAIHDAVPGNERRHVLLVSDGRPTAGGNEGGARDAATRLWGDLVDIWTLHVQNSNPQNTAEIENLEKLMRSISGAADAHPDGSYYRQAHTGKELAQQFRTIASLIACEIGPIEPVPPDPNNVYIFLSAGLGDEEGLLDSRREGATKASDLADPDQSFKSGRYFFYRPDNQVLYVTESVCDDIIDGGKGVVVRFQPPRLYE